MEQAQAIFELLFKRDHADPGNKDFLESITAAHPYFSPAQFYLLQQTEQGTPEFEKQAAKTNIFFNNPYWLNFQLQPLQAGAAKEEPVSAPVINMEEGRLEDPLVEILPVFAEEPQMEVVHRAVEEKAVETDIETEQSWPEEKIEETQPGIYHETIEQKTEEPVTEMEQPGSEEKVEEPQPWIYHEIAEEKTEQPIIEITGPVTEEKVEEPGPGIYHETAEESTAEPEIETVQAITGERVEEKYEESGHFMIEENTEELRTGIEDMTVEEKAKELQMEMKEAEPGINSAEEKNVMEELPLFEPMHMVDYFASQGIRLSEEAQTADKLGRQLRSFTEWLKTMKKVHADVATDTSAGSDSSIQLLAEKSNKEDEVLTVSMADVFAKQGKVDKAIEVLQKLSLLNPHKSAYFAAKIEYLKGL